MPLSSDNAYVVQPVWRALGVLTFVAEHGHEVSLALVSTTLRLPKTTTFRYLRTLVAAGFLRYDAGSELYGIGPRFHMIAKADTSLNAIREIARPAMQRLLEEFNETVNLAVHAHGSVVYVDLLEARRSLRMQARIGDSHPLHSTALGKAILAFLPDAERIAYLSQPFTERTGRTLIDRTEIDRQLRQIRTRGYATEAGENEDGAMCVGAPILDDQHRPVAAISISAPLQRMSRQLVVQAGKRLVETVASISAAFGHSAKGPFLPAK